MSRFLLCAAAAMAVCTACAIPRSTVLLMPDGALKRRGIDSIPVDWDGRALRVSTVPGTIGGAATHRHEFAHDQEGIAEMTAGAVRPLGIDRLASNATHLHALRAVSQSPTFTGEESNLPPSRELVARLVGRAQRTVPKGTIIAYAGTALPRGWRTADGSDGTVDLRAQYVVLKRVAASLEPRGSATHSHTAAHRHQWIASQPDPMDGRSYTYVVDTLSAALPSQTYLASVRHDHAAVEFPGFVGRTDTVTALPPSIVVRFIQATDDLRSLPAGALVPFAGTNTPCGWLSWTSRTEPNAKDRFIVGESAERSIGSLFGALSHSHLLPHSHEVLLDAAVGDTTGVRRANGVPAADARHAHRAVTVSVAGAAPADAIPEFVGLRFILKR